MLPATAPRCLARRGVCLNIVTTLSRLFPLAAAAPARNGVATLRPGGYPSRFQPLALRAGDGGAFLFGADRYRVEIDLRLPNRTSPAFAIRGGAAGLRGAADRTLRLPVIRLRPRALSDAPSFVALHDVLVPIQSDEALLA